MPKLAGEGRDHGKIMDLSCESCVRLWAEYVAAVREMRNTFKSSSSVRAQRARKDAVLKVILEHEAHAHTKPIARSTSA